MRSKGANRRSNLSPVQLEQQAKFALGIKFTRTTSDLLEISFRGLANQMTGTNSAQSLIVKNAITGVFPDLRIDYSKVAVAKRSLRNAVGATAASPSLEVWIPPTSENLKRFRMKIEGLSRCTPN